MNLCIVAMTVASITLAACASPSHKAPIPTDELAPTGKLRVGVVVANVASPFLATKNPDTGLPRGVTVDLGTMIARQIGVPVEIVAYAVPPALAEGVKAGAVDLTFAPVDAERAKVMDFGPAYFTFDNTYLVLNTSSIQNASAIDQPGTRIATQAGGLHVAQLKPLLKHATLTTAATQEDLQEMLRAGRADVIAHARPILVNMSKRVPGSRVVDGRFSTSSVAVAVPLGRAKALAYVSNFIEETKASGAMQQAFDRAGLTGYAVAPPNGR